MFRKALVPIGIYVMFIEIFELAFLNKYFVYEDIIFYYHFYTQFKLQKPVSLFCSILAKSIAKALVIFNSYGIQFMVFCLQQI